MATYQYKCSNDHSHEESRSIHAEEPVVICPECQEQMKKVFGTPSVNLVGRGFYRNGGQCKIESVKQILLRILATFAATGLSVVGAGAIAGIPLWKAVLMAGIGGVSFVVEGLARAFMDDGKLTVDEINDVFNKVDKKSK